MSDLRIGTPAPLPPPNTGDDLAAGPSADQRAAVPMTADDNARMYADLANPGLWGSLLTMSSADQKLGLKMIQTLEQASRGDSPAAKLTRNALDQLLSGRVRFRFDDPANMVPGAAAQAWNGVMTLNRDWFSKPDRGPNDWVAAATHEVTHAVNGDNGIMDGATRDFEEEYRSWVVDYRATYGSDPSVEQAQNYITSVLGIPDPPNTSTVTGPAAPAPTPTTPSPYTDLSQAYRGEPIQKMLIDHDLARINAGYVDPEDGIETCN
jgi:hypothetical protein